MENFKVYLVKNIVLLASVFFIMPSNTGAKDSLGHKKDTITKPNIYTQAKKTISQPDSINVSKIIEEAKQTVDAYNKVQIEKSKVSKESLNLSKIEIQNTKISNKLMEKLIKKYKDEKNEVITYGQIQKDSTCIKSVKYLFKKTRVCTDWQIDYYVMSGNKKIIIETIKEER